MEETRIAATKWRILWVLLFAVAAVLWSRYLERPVDLPSWHEFDYSSIARNFVTEGDNILYPRIDWRRDGPGFTEMEFPLQPWMTAQLYRMFGVHEWLGRLIPLAATLLSLALFGKLARQLLPSGTAWLAALFFVVNRTTLFVASAIQPEALMLLFYLLAVYCFLRWLDGRSWLMYGAAIVSFAGAMLIKSPAAHLGIFFFLIVFQKDGWRLFKRWELWVFVLLSFVPVIAWYTHAYRLWLTYQNSMGVSNEDHWIGLDILRRPKVVLGLFSIELVFVTGLGGAVAIAFAMVKEIRQQSVFRTASLWLVSILIYYVVIIRTAGQYWAWYYHIVAVPPVALLLACAASRLQHGTLQRRWAMWGGVGACVLLALVFGAAAHRDWSSFPGVVQDLLTPSASPTALFCMLCLTLGLSAVVSAVMRSGAPVANVRRMSLAGSALLGASIATYFMVSGQLTRATWSQFGIRSAEYACVSCFSDKVTPGVLIVSSGGVCKDAAGHRLASDSPEMFYWLNRKGFSTCEGEQSVAQLREYARRGARFFIAKKAAVREQPSLEQSLKNSFSLIGECKTAWLFELRQD